MKLIKARVTEFRSIRDSGEFEVGNITCLVGKNEAGKTAILQALHRLNPLASTAGAFNVTDDYPRSDVSEYEQDVKSGELTPAHVITAIFELTDAQAARIENEFGAGVLRSRELTLQRGYYTTHYITLQLDNAVACKHLVSKAQLPSDLAEKFEKATTLAELQSAISGADQNDHTKRLAGLVAPIAAKKGFILAAYGLVDADVPHFLYFDEFYQMRGHENLEALKQRQTENKLQRSDYPLLGLISYAGLTIDDLLNPARTQDLKNRLEGAGNRLSRTILKYWSQNKHIHMRFDVRPAKSGDPAGMQSGTNVWAEVYDSKHLATTGVSERSRGFVWFFSFLAWYAEQQRSQKSIILLLDEPGLALHGTAQGDLLRYIETELGESHQVIYTTHSPFMVDSKHLERVRIVQDRGMEQDDVPPEDDGTKVFADVLRATSGSLFPLHGALGFEIQQTLFVGPYVLIVEGASDLLYLQTISGVLERKGRTGLSPKWVITPVGGIDKVPAFAALFGAQKSLTVATLIDLQNKDVQTVQNLYKQKLLEKKRVLTYAQFVGTAEADVEDMFGDEFYLGLVSAEFKRDLAAPITPSDLPHGGPRVLARLESLLETRPLKNGTPFNHYRPGRYFSEKISKLESTLPEVTLERFQTAFETLNGLLV